MSKHRPTNIDKLIYDFHEVSIDVLLQSHFIDDLIGVEEDTFVRSALHKIKKNLRKSADRLRALAFVLEKL